jgi:hypothetical protein
MREATMTRRKLGDLAVAAGDVVVRVHGDPSVEITGLAYDSRRAAPGTLFFCVLGVWYLAFGDARYRTFAVASGTALVLAMSSTAILGLPGAPWGWHHYRYVLPFFPLVLVFAVVGFYSLGSLRGKTWLPEARAGLAAGAAMSWCYPIRGGACQCSIPWPKPVLAVRWSEP